MAHKTLIGGTAYGIKGGRTLVNGTGYGVQNGRALVGGTGYAVSFAPPVGTTWLFTSNGTFTVPATGSYQVELHGGGGGGGGYYYYYDNGTPRRQTGGGGGGSGELMTLNLKAGDRYEITIGAGGSAGRQNTAMLSVVDGGDGGTTFFGSYSVAGGKGGKSGSYGGSFSSGGRPTGTAAASGSIATAADGNAGGYGNKNNTSQTYGNGGKGASDGVAMGPGEAGKRGAICIAYLGN